MISYLRLLFVLIVLSILHGSASAQDAATFTSHTTQYAAPTGLEYPLFSAAPRWWEETVQWVRGLGWDRGRLVQLWLFFMLIGLYIILRIKPRA